MDILGIYTNFEALLATWEYLLYEEFPEEDLGEFMLLKSEKVILTCKNREPRLEEILDDLSDLKIDQTSFYLTELSIKIRN